MKEYNFSKIEEKWQKIWEENKLYQTPDILKKSEVKKYYLLEMFAYPSGDIHIGHFRNYSIGDVIARFKRMEGYKVLHPFGWDAFGLPAEEAAIKHKTHPRIWALNNIAISKSTLKKLGISYDWDREIITCLPDYYKWTQWLFLKLFEKGLAYQNFALVNWCPSCKTVLANEQIEEGKCWRCKSQASKKELKQWFFKITDYAEKLLADLENLSGWPENVKAMQRYWIGKSIGVEIKFKLEENQEEFFVFTTRADTIYGVTFIAVSPEHSLAKKIALGAPCEKEVLNYIEKAKLKSEIERTSTITKKDGVFTGKYAFNPLSGEKVKIFVADYVLASYGTGIVMGVPAHDQRDFEFAKTYDIPIKIVIKPKDEELNLNSLREAYVEEGILVNSNNFSNLNSKEAVKTITDYIIKNNLGISKTNYKLRDWLISRQRYWGAPIPIIHCEYCGIVPVHEKDLPVLLPEGEIDFIPKGRSPLADIKEFMEVNCPKCGKTAHRDPDTMDTFVCSSWYYLRYLDPHNEKEIFDPGTLKWLPIDQYIGGIEHATGHLIYFRFINKVLHDLNFIPYSEPAVNLFNHGMVLDKNGEVMSKSKGNVISPVNLIRSHGVDAARLAMFFAAPSGKEVIWKDDLIKGVERFIKRIYNLCVSRKIKGKDFIELQSDVVKMFILEEEELNLLIKLHKTIKNVRDDLETKSFNTAISTLMEFLNALVEFKDNNSHTYNHSLINLILMLAPFTPHLAEEIWEYFRFKESIFNYAFPSFNDVLFLKEKEITMVIQINGKVRGQILIPPNLPDEEIKNLVLKVPKIKEFINHKEIKKVILVKNRLINLVI